MDQGQEPKHERPESPAPDSRLPTPDSFVYSIVLLHVVLHALIISALSGLGPISRHEWGQRYLLPAYPGLVALSLLAAWSIWSRYSDERRRLATATLAIWALLALVGVGFSARGYVMLRDEREQVVAWQGLARTLPAREPLVTDVWWLPLNLAADFYTRPIMLAQGDERLAHWARQMRERGVPAFGLMTTDPAGFEGTWRAQVHGVAADGPPKQVRGMWLQRYAIAP